MSTESVPAVEQFREWRCFHCDEVFTTAQMAAIHFGDDIDHRPGCIEKLNAPEKNLVLALRKICDEFRRLQMQVSEEITNDVYFYSRLRSSLATIKPFANCISLHDVFMLFDSLEGRVLAAEADRARLDAIAAEYLHIVPFEMPTGAGDADVGWDALQSTMGTKHAALLGRVFEDDPRKVIDAAIANGFKAVNTDGTP
jgi:hypothetical protein